MTDKRTGRTKLGKFLGKLGGGAVSVLSDIMSGKNPASAIFQAVTNGKLSVEDAELAFKYHQEDLKDVQNARDNETKRDTSSEAPLISKTVHEIIAYVVTGAWIVSWWVPALVTFGDIKDVILLILGYLYGRSRPQ